MSVKWSGVSLSEQHRTLVSAGVKVQSPTCACVQCYAGSKAWQLPRGDCVYLLSSSTVNRLVTRNQPSGSIYWPTLSVEALPPQREGQTFINTSLISFEGFLCGIKEIHSLLNLLAIKSGSSGRKQVRALYYHMTRSYIFSGFKATFSNSWMLFPFKCSVGQS